MGHNWNLIMTAPVKPMCLFTAKFVVVAKLALLTHAFVFVLYVFCGRVYAHFSGWPPIELPLFLIRGALGALAVIAAQLVLAMIIRSFAVPIFLGLLGGIVGLFISSKGYALLWPYALMQMGMNAENTPSSAPTIPTQSAVIGLPNRIISSSSEKNSIASTANVQTAR